MLRLSEEAQADASKLARCLSRPRLWRKKSAERDLIQRLANHGEAGALPVLALALADRGLRDATAIAIRQLLEDVPARQLIHMGAMFGGAYSLHASQAWSHLKPVQVDRLAGQGPHRPFVLGLLSFHHNGFVRHAAVKLLGNVTSGSELAYLLIRQNDWVDPISRDARQLVRERLTQPYLKHFVRLAALVVHLRNFQRRDLSSVLRDMVALLVQTENAALLADAFRHEDRDSRRCIARIALEVPGLHRDHVVRIGMQSDDPVVRLRCSRHVGATLCREEAVELCQGMLTDTFMPVRREGYLLKVKLFPNEMNEIWQVCLLDKSRSLRELARYQLKDAGTDVSGVYRVALAKHPYLVTALAGLAETGDVSDLPLLKEQLHAPLASCRAEAIRGVGRLGGKNEVPELVAALSDVSPRVACEATRQLEPHASQLGAQYLVECLAKDAPEHSRRNVLKLVFGLGKWRSLPVLLRVAAMEDDRQMAAYAETLIELWFTWPRSVRSFTEPSDAQRKQWLAALAYAKPRVRPEFGEQLAEWLRTFHLA